MSEKQQFSDQRGTVKLFVAFPLVVTSTGPGVFMVVCVFYDGNSRRLNRKWFMEKLGIEPATPGCTWLK